MPIQTVIDYESDTETRYRIELPPHVVHATLTASGADAGDWIREVQRIHHRRLHKLIVGLDVEWRPSYGATRNPVATLQLCVGVRCLVFQILRADYIPESLTDFLDDPDYRFVGVGVGDDVEKLEDDYDIQVGQTVDLRPIAAEQMGMKDLKQAGLKGLSSVVLGVDVERPRRIAVSGWDAETLNREQVQYAAMDAYLSFEIGKTLLQ